MDWKSALAENFFLRTLSIIMAVSLIIAVLFAVQKKQRVIVIPPQVTKEFWIDQDQASPELMEQTAVFLSSLLGNISPQSAEFSVTTFSKWYLDSGKKEIREELEAQASYIKKNSITQSFFPARTIVDDINGQVSVEGLLTTAIGSVKASSDKVIYRIKFYTKAYRLWVEELYIEKTKMDDKKKKADKE